MNGTPNAYIGRHLVHRLSIWCTDCSHREFTAPNRWTDSVFGAPIVHIRNLHHLIGGPIEYLVHRLFTYTNWVLGQNEWKFRVRQRYTFSLICCESVHRFLRWCTECRATRRHFSPFGAPFRRQKWNGAPIRIIIPPLAHKNNQDFTLFKANSNIFVFFQNNNHIQTHFYYNQITSYFF